MKKFSQFLQLPGGSIAYFWIAFCWVIGLAAGYECCNHADESYFLLMQSASHSCLSIVGLAVCVYLPFLIAAFADLISRAEWIPAICFFKGVLFSCHVFTVEHLYGSAAWLARFLFLFSDTTTIVFFLWFCVRCMLNGKRTLWKDFLVCSIAVLLCGITDVCLISPFWMKIIKF